MLHKLQKNPDIFTVWTILTFAIDYSQFKSAQLLETIFIILSEPHAVFRYTQIGIKQR